MPRAFLHGYLVSRLPRITAWEYLIFLGPPALFNTSPDKSAISETASAATGELLLGAQPKPVSYGVIAVAPESNNMTGKLVKP